MSDFFSNEQLWNYAWLRNSKPIFSYIIYVLVKLHGGKISVRNDRIQNLKNTYLLKKKKSVCMIPTISLETVLMCSIFYRFVIILFIYLK